MNNEACLAKSFLDKYWDSIERGEYPTPRSLVFVVDYRVAELRDIQVAVAQWIPNYDGDMPSGQWLDSKGKALEYYEFRDSANNCGGSATNITHWIDNSSMAYALAELIRYHNEKLDDLNKLQIGSLICKKCSKDKE